MKKGLSTIFFLAMCFTLLFYSQIGKSNKAIITIGASKQFSEKEIDEAIDCIKDKFKDFKGCDLTALWYDEEQLNSFIEGYMRNGKGSINGVIAENVIVFLSNFDVDSSGAREGFNPNSTYYVWNWILIRDNKKSKWEADDWGY